MFDHETFNSRHVEKTGDDPLIPLIAEYYRKEKSHGTRRLAQTS